MMTDRMRLRRAIVVPRYTPFAMRGSVLFGFNVLLISRIQLSLLAHKLIDRKIRRQTKDKRQAKGTISK
jgi:hypothetical protein